MKVLVVEDDDDTAKFVVEALRDRGHSVEWSDDGEEGLSRCLAREFDVIALDRMLPGKDGLEIVATMRACGIATPVLLLTNLSGLEDRVEGLQSGGDDYLVKPFAIEELVARLVALARRPTLGVSTTVLRAGDLEMDLVNRTVKHAGETIELPPREFELLEVLLRMEGRIATRKMLLERVWKFHFDPQTNIVETHMSRLRANIDRGEGPSLIRTVRGVGYCLRV
jgi:two-component system OmpR family response regulator